MTDLRRVKGAAALLPIALIFAACSSSAASTAPSGSGGTDGAASAAASTAAGASSGAAASPGESGLAIPSFDIGELTQGLANLDSYQVSITVGGVEAYKGTVVTKPVLSRDITVSGGTRIVVIGQDAWVAQGGGPLTAVPAAMATSLFASFDPTLLVGAFSGTGLAQYSTHVGSEQKNGVDSQHYTIDSTSLAGAFASMAPGATIDVWIADKGFLVALETKGMSTTGKDVSIQVTNVDDPANKVDKPS